MQEIGFLLAAAGAVLTVVATLLNNLRGRHRLAMKIWGAANPAMFFWAAGFLLGYWTADLGITIFLIMYGIFWITGWYGLLKFRGRGLP